MKLITSVAEGSVAEELGIQAGDFLVEVNGQTVRDVFDYQALADGGYAELLVERGGERTLYEVEMDEGEVLGLEFETWLMDKRLGCSNKCVFCFIDQMPKGLRDELYFKDDDLRLSFISGNYVTLTNVSDAELDRLIGHRLSPLNISVHTMDAGLRMFMMGNKKAGFLRRQLDRLYAAGIQMNFQVVLCKGINDGERLKDTVRSLAEYLPWGNSLAVVPAGLTKFREGLHKLTQFTSNEASAVIDTIHAFQAEFLDKHETRFVFAADEFYFMAGRELPEYEEYEEFPQLANGVGMMRLFIREFEVAKKAATKAGKRPPKSTAVTGELAFPVIKRLFEGTDISAVPITNRFFGETVTVSGLVTGGDLIEQLGGRELGECLFIPANMLKADEAVFLDNVTIDEVRRRFNVPIKVIKSAAEMFFSHRGTEK